MADLTLRNIRKSFGALEVLHGIDLDIRSGEFIVFVGPSGCGKSTLLRAIAGLDDITSGEFRIDGEVMNEVPPSARGISMVFQSYALYPHMTVFDNMAFGMKIAGLPRAEIRQRVARAAEILQLTPYLARFPKALSGGQRQRVAIGRAIVRNPRVFLFDEPLSNLDAALRVATRIEIARLKQSMPGTTMIYVTHDQVEAMTLADRIVVFRDGNIEQIGAPLDLYRHPANLFVARFIGSPAMNVLPATVAAVGERGQVRLGDRIVSTEITVPDVLRDARVSLGVRPEDLRLVPAGQGSFSGVVALVEQLGEVQLTYVSVPETDELVIAKLPGMTGIKPGDSVALTAEAAHLHLFDEKGSTIALPPVVG